MSNLFFWGGGMADSSPLHFKVCLMSISEPATASKLKLSPHNPTSGHNPDIFLKYHYLADA